MTTWKSPHKVVLYEGEKRYRVKTPDHEPPTDSEGKAKKVVHTRPMTPREHMAYSRKLWTEHRAKRQTPKLLGS